MRNGETTLGLRSRNGGFTLLALLAWFALLSAGAAVVGPTWAQQSQREREQDLLRFGDMYAAALEEYFLASPGSDRQFPQSLQALTVDPRFAGTVRHMRQLHPDPLAPAKPWGLLRNGKGEIIGVFSQSSQRPIAQANKTLGNAILPASTQYSDWKFVARSAQ